MAIAISQSLKPKTLIQNYEIESVLGIGGFGITYLAKETRLQQLVALKEYMPCEFAVRDENDTIQPKSSTHKELFRWGIDRFLQEGQTLARFHHNSLVRIYNYFEENGTAYIVMEYETGKSLASHIRAHGHIQQQDIINLIMPLLEGLELLHDNAIIHRDIKPANIYMRSDASPVLLDFGAARHAMGKQTKTVTAMLSPGYAPLEQYNAGGTQLGPWTDIYGLGSVCYHMIAGKKPIESILRGSARMNDEPDPLGSLQLLAKLDYSPAFLDAVNWAMQLTWKDRPQSIDAWRDALKQTSSPLPNSSLVDVMHADNDPVIIASAGESFGHEKPKNSAVEETPTQRDSSAGLTEPENDNIEEQYSKVNRIDGGDDDATIKESSTAINNEASNQDSKVGEDTTLDEAPTAIQYDTLAKYATVDKNTVTSNDNASDEDSTIDETIDDSYNSKNDIVMPLARAQASIAAKHGIDWLNKPLIPDVVNSNDRLNKSENTDGSGIGKILRALSSMFDKERIIKNIKITFYFFAGLASGLLALMLFSSFINYMNIFYFFLFLVVASASTWCFLNLYKLTKGSSEFF